MTKRACRARGPLPSSPSPPASKPVDDRGQSDPTPGTWRPAAISQTCPGRDRLRLPRNARSCGLDRRRLPEHRLPHPFPPSRRAGSSLPLATGFVARLIGAVPSQPGSRSGRHAFDAGLSGPPTDQPKPPHRRRDARLRPAVPARACAPGSGGAARDSAQPGPEEKVMKAPSGPDLSAAGPRRAHVSARCAPTPAGQGAPAGRKRAL